MKKRLELTLNMPPALLLEISRIATLAQTTVGVVMRVLLAKDIVSKQSNPEGQAK